MKKIITFFILTIVGRSFGQDLTTGLISHFTFDNNTISDQISNSSAIVGARVGGPTEDQFNNVDYALNFSTPEGD